MGFVSDGAEGTGGGFTSLEGASDTELLDIGAPDEDFSSEGADDQSTEAEPDAPESEAAEGVEPEAEESEGTDSAEISPAGDADVFAPYSYAVGREAIPVTGVWEHAKGGQVEVPPGTLLVHPEVKGEISRAMEQARLRQTVDLKETNALKRQLREKESRFSENEVRVKKTLDYINGICAKGPEAVWEYFSNWKQQEPILEAQRINAIAQTKLDAAMKLGQPEPEVQAQQDQEVQVNTVRELTKRFMVQEVGGGKKFNTLPEAQQDKLREKWDKFGMALERNGGQLWRRATTGDLQANPQLGLKVGQLIYDSTYVNDMYRWYLGVLGQQATKESSLSDARDFNAKRNVQGVQRPKPSTNNQRRPAQPAPRRELTWDERRQAAYDEVLTRDDGKTSLRRAIGG